MKRCSKCKKQKDESEFGKNRKSKDGLQNWCKMCKREYRHRYYRRNRASVKQYIVFEECHRTIDSVKQKRCTKCKKWKDESEFSKNRNRKDELGCWCKDCQRAYTRKRYKNKRGSVKKYNNYKDLHRVAGGVKQKRCGRCKKWKAENQYYQHSRHKDGLAVWCKECANQATNKARKKRLAIRN